MSDPTPFQMSVAVARQKIRELAEDSDRIVVISHGKARGRQRGITRRQMELCVQKGVIIEGPFLNQHGNWQVTIQRRAAGEEVNCVVAIDWPNRLVIITTY
ncbi:MAG: DUF4258 domain-containing protein [Sphingopyxis sp.]|uniref:DUF4258 domain-containing protein n=1 Tax=Sphingopyxis sp. TaxID=1908224 RepID=UPI001A5125B9|nr:DUF4258 domain-containing protein [Sphingopyxis sp.]MBL9065545.1 DUF4258 domain-containing protein [Sphingopyxis sp.]